MKMLTVWSVVFCLAALAAMTYLAETARAADEPAAFVVAYVLGVSAMCWCLVATAYRYVMTGGRR